MTITTVKTHEGTKLSRADTQKGEEIKHQTTKMNSKRGRKEQRK
jgi:hypothetical protein